MREEELNDEMIYKMLDAIMFLLSETLSRYHKKKISILGDSAMNHIEKLYPFAYMFEKKTKTYKEFWDNTIKALMKKEKK